MSRATNNIYYDARSDTRFTIVAILATSPEYVTYHGYSKSENREIILHLKRNTAFEHYDVPRKKYECRVVMGQTKGMEYAGAGHAHPAKTRKAQGGG